MQRMSETLLSSPTELKLSIALVTRNRPESLQRTLESWLAQTVAPFEIVVSDDSDDEKAKDIEILAKKYECVYVRGPRLGLYANRNRASLACLGTHILSADDDHTHPNDFLEKLIGVIKRDPNRVWILPERLAGRVNAPISCPPELHRSGYGDAPKDPSDCAAIADGSSVYPRQIFDQGLRYDETYPFGGVWYLWGKVLVKHGWRISYSDATFLWHHHLTEGRYADIEQLKLQLEVTTYVQFVNALRVEPTIPNLAWSVLYLLRRMVWTTSNVHFAVKTRIEPASAWRALTLAWNWKDIKIELLSQSRERLSPEGRLD